MTQFDWDKIEADRRDQLEKVRFADFLKTWEPEDPHERHRFASELHHLIATAVEYHTNTITKMYAAAVALQPMPPFILKDKPT